MVREGSTPLRQQYLRIKRKYPQAIVMFRLGDFYETFDEDAKAVSRDYISKKCDLTSGIVISGRSRNNEYVGSMKKILI